MLQRKMTWAALILSTVGTVTLGSAHAADPGAVLDDSMITAKIKAELVQDPATKARQIKVKTYHGVVQLSGFVDSADSQNRAADIARGTEGVKDVHNRLTLRVGDNSPGQVLDNTLLTTQVKAALVKNPDTKARQIKVSTQGDIVKLSGFVDSYAQKEQAYKVAAGVDGVRDVRNEIEVKTASP